MTLFIYDDMYLQHDTGQGHPENAKRLLNTREYLRTTKIMEQVLQESPRAASTEEINLVHPQSYVQSVKQIAEGGGGWLDDDTAVSGASYQAAIYAAGAVLKAADSIMEEKEKNAFCLIRPPGHHATPERGMGFCLFNNAAIAAKYLQTHYHLKKILIVDWDVHHGNGTQDTFYEDPTVMYFSMHRYPFYPGTGQREENGKGEGRGFNINIPLPANTDNKEYKKIFSEVIEEQAELFAPEFIIISAGFDAYKKDPIGGLNLEIEDFGILTEIVLKAAQNHCNGKLISCLEGGYNLQDLPLCISAHVKGLLQI